MRLVIRVDYGRGPLDVSIMPRAFIGYEKANKTKMSALANDGIGISDLAELAWRQLVIDETFTGPLAEFEDLLLDVEPVSEENPTSTGTEVSLD